MTWHLVEGATELFPDNGMMAIHVEDTNIAVVRMGDEYFALANICTHQYALLTDGFIEDGCIECPLHQGLFDVRTGQAQGAPVTKDLKTFATRIDNGQLWVNLQEPGQVASDATEPSLETEESSAGLEQHIVIVGGGQAAAVAVRTLRGKGFAGKLTLVSDEYQLPYERPPLSKGVLLNQTLWSETVLLTQQDAEELNINLILGQPATQLDTQQKRLTLANGQDLHYDKLLIATGARNRALPVAGADLPVVYDLRTLDDAIALKQALKPNARVAIIGGGFIGLEVASSAVALGCQVTLLEASSRLCSRAMHPRAAMHLHQSAEQAGVRIKTYATVESIKMDQGVASLRLASGDECLADVIVVGIGVIPNCELAQQAGLVVSDGIQVNEFGQTSDPSVYAAGDVAIWPKVTDSSLRLESWQNAQEQAISAASTMAGEAKAYDVIPWFWTDQFGQNIQMLGLPNSADGYKWVANTQGGTYYFYNDTQFTGVVAFNDPAAIKQARRWLSASLKKDALLQALEGSQNNDGLIASTRNHRSTNMSDFAQYFEWPKEGLRRIPDWVYTDPAIYQLEVEKIFHGPNWNYVGLEAEIPNSGDFIRSFVGPTAVIVSRDEEGEIHVFMNRCSHRAAEFCRELRGNNAEFVCPYHQWTYDLKGNLAGIPFRRGVGGKGGLPKDFDRAAHNPTKLKVTTRNGVIFASFSDAVPTLEEYLGPRLVEEFDATFDGRKLKVLGYYRNTVPGNWKLYHENLKDPYHATLLHTFLVSFGLLVAGNKAEMICDETGRHGVMASAKTDAGRVSEEDSKEMRAYKPDFQLKEPSMLDFHDEFDSPWSVTMMTLWPNLIVQREMNTLGVRQIVPQGPNEFVMNWTMFGFEGDSEATIKHRMRQGNLMGPAGFLGLEDNEAMKFVQDGMKRSIAGEHLIEMDPKTEVGTADNLISESAIRAMYQYWRKELGIQ